MPQGFSPDENYRLETSKRTIVRKNRTIVYCSFENRFCIGGGLGKVTINAPVGISRAGEKIILLSPLHHRMRSCMNGLEKGLIFHTGISFDTRFGGSDFTVDLFRYDESVTEFEWGGEVIHTVPCYLVGTQQLFNSPNSPYERWDPGDLLFEALFFADVVPQVLIILPLQ